MVQTAPDIYLCSYFNCEKEITVFDSTTEREKKKYNFSNKYDNMLQYK